VTRGGGGVRSVLTLLWSHSQVQAFALLLEHPLETRGHIGLSEHGLPLNDVHVLDVSGDGRLRTRMEWSELILK